MRNVEWSLEVLAKKLDPVRSSGPCMFNYYHFLSCLAPFVGNIQLSSTEYGVQRKEAHEHLTVENYIGYTQL